MKKNIFLLSAVFLFCLYCCACSGSKVNPTSKTLITGNYHFALSDSLWRVLLNGTMNVDTTGGNVTGSYKISVVKDSSFYGYSMLRGGGFTGKYDKTGGFISLNMNPKVADANVYITLKIRGEYLTGTWNYATMSGNLNGGNIKAALE
jgi:hypothetical protein